MGCGLLIFEIFIMAMFYSAKNNAFYDYSLIKEYKNSGSWPEDAKQVSPKTYREFSNHSSNKMMVPGEGGLPKWITRATTKKDCALKQRALLKAATYEINILSEERDAGIISDDDLERWKAWVAYRKSLRELDVTATDIKWPAKPE